MKLDEENIAKLRKSRSESQYANMVTAAKELASVVPFYRVVDLDERGSYKAHIEDHDGHTVYEYSNEDESGNPTDFWLVQDGFMKHPDDLEGLSSYLKSIEILPQEALLQDSSKKEHHGKAEAAMDSPAVYVGTYGKYNNGDLTGAWLKLDDYVDQEDFYKAAKELHKDEADPELMFQDYENFPEKFYGESEIAKELWDWLELSENQRDLLEAYIELTGDKDASIREAEDAYLGTYDSESDWAYDFLEQTGGLSPEAASRFIFITDTDRRIIAGEEADLHVEDMEEGDEKEEARDEKYEEVYKALEDPVGYFVDDTGMYSIEDLMKANFISVDYDAYARDASMSGDINFVRKDGKVLVFHTA